jgi:Fic family protein
MTERPFWRPITDLPAGWEDLCSRELASLAPIWRDQAARLKNTKALVAFNERVKRQWAIKTGIIEGLYSIDRGTTMLLIEHGFDLSLIRHGSTDRPPERILDIVIDQQTVLEHLFDFVGGTRQLTTSYIEELHALFTRHQSHATAVDARGRHVEVELVRGEWKKLPNNPRRNGHVFLYCPPEHVAAEMHRLLDSHTSHGGVCLEVESAWLHHRFTQIHPFQDGLGRRPGRPARARPGGPAGSATSSRTSTAVRCAPWPSLPRRSAAPASATKPCPRSCARVARRR